MIRKRRGWGSDGMLETGGRGERSEVGEAWRKIKWEGKWGILEVVNGG